MWRGQDEVRFTPKAFAVLQYLLDHAGQVITKDELFRVVWSETVVSEAALTVCIRELRQKLGDHAKTPQYIETVHKRGYRFIGKVVSGQSSVLSPLLPPSRSQLTTDNWQLTTPLVGRDAELAQLHSFLDKALNGERQIVFVTGEPGIGKTALLETFLARAVASSKLQVPSATLVPTGSQSLSSPAPNPQSPTPGVWLGWGQCVEQFGEGEAYLPILTALGQLGRSTVGPQIIEVLKPYRIHPNASSRNSPCKSPWADR
jgi:DNA-binding winged helix-turn-helix (wHTH) protein